jgi:hypothetical protein
MERTLDRIKIVDLRDLNHLVQVSPKYRPRSFTWRPRHIPLDQGAEGACVGFGWTHELAARPVIEEVTDAFAREFYFDAQRNDEWEGGAYPGAVEHYDGSSVRGGAKVAVQRGHITGYRWCTTVDEIVKGLGYDGTVVMGVDWYEGMFDTDDAGFIRPTGKIEGGHCVDLYGVRVIWNRDATIDPVASYVEGINSWGPDWGVSSKWTVGGTFRIALVDLAVLLSGGDFCVPLGRKRLTGAISQP